MRESCATRRCFFKECIHIRCAPAPLLLHVSNVHAGCIGKLSTRVITFFLVGLHHVDELYSCRKAGLKAQQEFPNFGGLDSRGTVGKALSLVSLLRMTLIYSSDGCLSPLFAVPKECLDIITRPAYI